MTDRDEAVRTPAGKRPGAGEETTAATSEGQRRGAGEGTPAGAPERLTPRTSRRSLLLGVGAVGAAGALAACGDGSSPAPAGNGGVPVPPTKTTPPVIKVADIPVGGGKIYSGARIVVTQPSRGEFRAFDATCQHAGCLVAEVKDGVIICPCHGSTYNVTDGSVHNGPTTKALPPKTATVTGDTIVVS